MGHLYEPFMPEDYTARYARWDLADLPIIPRLWESKPSSNAHKQAQLRIVLSLVQRARTVILATDAGREGELIGREILEAARFKGELLRYWIKSTNIEALRKVMAAPLPGQTKESLWRSAVLRQRADWLFGLNLSRAIGLHLAPRGERWSYGRVQTPTLALIVRRDLEIEGFVPRAYFDLEVNVSTDKGDFRMWHRPADELRIFDRNEAERRAASSSGKQAGAVVKDEECRQLPPKIFEIGTLQGEANARFGWSAAHTLEVAQKLYDDGFISYPRTDCVFLDDAAAMDVESILNHLHALGWVTDIGKPVMRMGEVFNSAKTTDHEGITPTLKQYPGSSGSDEDQLYSLVALRYAQAMSPDFLYRAKTITADFGGINFRASGRAPIDPGWKRVRCPKQKLDPEDEPVGEAEDELPAQQLPDVESGEQLRSGAVKVCEKVTRPPMRYTEKTLLADMMSIGKFVTDPVHRKILKETSGIGTGATRADIIEGLKAKALILKNGRQLISSPGARVMVSSLPPELVDPALTAIWEEQLECVVRGDKQPDKVYDGFLLSLQKNLERILALPAVVPEVAPEAAVAAETCSCGSPMQLRKGASGSFWGCSRYPECRVTKPVEGQAKRPPHQPKAQVKGGAPVCEKCGQPMQKRKGQKGEFWGCPGYPECRFTRPFAEDAMPKARVRGRGPTTKVGKSKSKSPAGKNTASSIFG